YQSIADFRVVDEQLLLCLLDESGEDLARALGTDDELVVRWRIPLPGAVGFEQRARFLDEPRLVRHDAEAAALLDIELRVIEAEDVQRVVDQHHFSVIA